MSEYYRLKDDYILRGWDRLPYVLLKRPGNGVMFLNKACFDALSLCDGNYDLSLGIIPQDVKNVVKEAEKEGVVEQCSRGEGLSEDQKYRKYDNRFIHNVHWSITGKCNYRCRHCYMSAPEAKFGELDHETIMDLIEQMADCGVPTVTLTGGEPLVRKDFMEIVDALQEHNIAIAQIYTNGKLVTRELLEKLQERGIRPEFNLSYDGDEGWHDWMRGIPNAGQIALDAFDLCYEMGFPIGSEMCLHKGNAPLLRQSVNTLAAHHVESCKINVVAPTEFWEKYGKDYEMTSEEANEIYLEYLPHYFEDGSPISLQLGGIFICDKGEKEWNCLSQKYDGGDGCLNKTVCGHARNNLYLSPEGRMLPCLSLTSCEVQYDYPLATEIGLKQGLTDSTYMSLIDTRLKDFFEINKECGSCEYAKVCAGGCRASSMICGGTDIMATDYAACEIFKGGWGKRFQDALDGIAEKKGPAFT